MREWTPERLSSNRMKMNTAAIIFLAILIPPLPLYLIQDKARARLNIVMLIVAAVLFFFVAVGPGLLMYVFTFVHSVRGIVLHALHREAGNVCS